MDKDVIEFLEESNKIESVYDNDSLVQAMNAWNYIIKQDVINLDVIKETHRLLMLNQKLNENEKGFFRTCPVYIGGREAVNHFLIENLLKAWCETMNYKSGLNQYIEDYSKDFHIKYEKIHPFVDGNGRTGRIFMNWYRIKNNLPLMIIHEGREQMEYYKWFQQTNG